MTDIHHSALAARAVEMIDWCDDDRSYRLPSGAIATFSFGRVEEALAQTRPRDEVDTHIIDCFDWFLYYIDRVEHYLQNGLILFEDVADTLRPYARTLKNREVAIDRIVELRCYDGVPAFLNRYPATARREVETRA